MKTGKETKKNRNEKDTKKIPKNNLNIVDSILT